MKRKLFGSLLYTALLCFVMCTAVKAEDMPMTEEEIFCVQEGCSFETEAEEAFITAEEEGYLEEDALIVAEEDGILESAGETVDIDENHFPDAKFLAYVKENIDEDGEIGRAHV